MTHQSPAHVSATDSLRIAGLQGKSVALFSSNPDSFAHIQLQIASLYKGYGQLGKWLNCYDTVINAYRKAGSYEKMLGSYDELYRNMWEAPADSFALVTLAESNRQVARYFYKTQNNYEKALHFYDEGIKLITKANGWTPDQARYFYKAAGNCASRMDDYEKSIDYHEQNVKTCRKFRDTINLWQALNDLSVPYTVAGQFDKAEKALRECYALNRNSDSVEQKIDACSSFSDLFLQQHKTDSASRYINLCLDYLQQWKNKETDSEADVYRMQGALYAMEQNYAAAEKSYDHAIELMDESDEGRIRECGKIYTEAGVMFLSQNKELQALQRFQHALHCFIPEFKTVDVTITPDSSLLYDENGLFESCEGKGDAYMKLYHKTPQVEYLRLASLNYHAAEIVLDKRDRDMVNESSRIKFNESVAGILAKAQTADSLLSLQRVNYQ